jgi:hypothetical protein
VAFWYDHQVQMNLKTVGWGEEWGILVLGEKRKKAVLVSGVLSV